ncbi:hypothetical protein ND748_00950 [Frankia sp. AiPs1]|uniref:hypothetical protein n=1 Tax=Frankia sp. AiPs1 TaxID=573493 RepID=UPI00204376B7|nr:hypothetical protein [Frankia sp. AiPs1]MCM3920257.1 hypothetical protein [Frankia sp. AiPs1]
MVGRPRQTIEALTPKVAAMAEYPRDVVLVRAYLAEAHVTQARAGLAAPAGTGAVLAGIAGSRS